MTAPADVAPADVSIRDLEKRWGISRNGLKARARALGVELIRVSSTLTTWPGDFIELGERLQDHLQSGQPMGTFPGLKPASAAGSATAVTPADTTAIVKAPGSDLAALVAALREAASNPATDALRRARGLAEAADNALVLTTSDLAALLGQGVMSWRSGHEAYGYRFERHHQGRQVLWTVSRAIAVGAPSGVRSLTGGNPTTSGERRVGFAAEAVIDVPWRMADTTGTRLFLQNRIG
ncbi:hypothetical protein [Cyanobium gracile]|uniref:Uncharacterized protein n=1 Tax=Cyanobium gracile (strain ATCC 27147 / PCC 6307) TaxID=292564 RepID=K9P2U7_CYAGP|nr:hypothetical protein [Cyanobium gracile]AFY27385.1 hypothetical protein Cyagr_0178 [Cyanobium gracile PCC 6307]